MMRLLLKSLLMVILVVSFLDNSSEAASTKAEIEALKQEMRQMQQQIQQLQNQINSMEGQREEANRKVYKILKKVDDPDKWYNKFEAGYDKGLYFKSSDGNYKMKFRIRGQFLVEINDTDNKLTKTELDVRRMRLKWDIHILNNQFAQLGAPFLRLRSGQALGAITCQRLPRLTEPALNSCEVSVSQ